MTRAISRQARFLMDRSLLASAATTTYLHRDRGRTPRSVIMYELVNIQRTDTYTGRRGCTYGTLQHRHPEGTLTQGLNGGRCVQETATEIIIMIPHNVTCYRSTEGSNRVHPGTVTFFITAVEVTSVSVHLTNGLLHGHCARIIATSPPGVGRSEEKRRLV